MRRSDPAAPILYFDGISTLGQREGVGHLSLTVRLYDLNEAAGAKVEVNDTVIAHLRFPLAMLDDLKRALDNIELAAQPSTSNKKN